MLEVLPEARRAARAGAVVDTPEFASWMRRLTQSYAELRQAIAWSLAHQDRAVTLRAAPALRELWQRRADAREVARWTGLMLEGDLEAVPPRLLAEVHVAATFVAVTANDVQAARSHLEDAVRLFREEECTRGLILARWTRSNVLLSSGDLEGVQRSSHEALAACDEHGDRWGRAGPLEAAERYATEAVERAAGTGWQAAALVRYAAVLIEQGAEVAAATAALRALGIARDAGLEIWFRQALRELARIAAGADRYDDAALLLAASRRNESR